jgi:hypothetical protein
MGFRNAMNRIGEVLQSDVNRENIEKAGEFLKRSATETFQSTTTHLRRNVGKYATGVTLSAALFMSAPAMANEQPVEVPTSAEGTELVQEGGEEIVEEIILEGGDSIPVEAQQAPAIGEQTTVEVDGQKLKVQVVSPDSGQPQEVPTEGEAPEKSDITGTL